MNIRTIAWKFNGGTFKIKLLLELTVNISSNEFLFNQNKKNMRSNTNICKTYFANLHE
jgi:hypothetical protein